ncbi:MAG: CdaR family protein [Tumebacillaceae bacterium]
MMDRLLQNNTVLKIIAGFLAILLWLVVHSGDDTVVPSGGITNTTQQLRDKAVTVLYDERNFSLVGEPKVTLNIHGSYLDVMNAISFGDSIKVIADATKLTEGVHEVPVFITGQPKGVSVDDAKVSIHLESNVSNDFTVKLITEGKPKSGYNVGDPVLSPQKVFVSGAKTAIDSIDQVVANISLDGADESIHTSVPLMVLDKAGKQVSGVSLSHDRVDVNIPINKPSKSVALRLQFKGDLAPGYAVESVDQTVSVTVFGSAKALDSLDSFPAPVIDLTGLNKTTKFDLNLTLPAGITSVQPQQVSVTVNVVQAAQRTFTDIPVKVTGLASGQSYTLAGTASDKVQVTVEGAKSLIDKLTNADINAFVDVTNQPAGHQDVRIQVNMPNFIKTLDIKPQTVTLDLNK